jgi:hypothetical protein
LYATTSESGADERSRRQRALEDDLLVREQHPLVIGDALHRVVVVVGHARGLAAPPLLHQVAEGLEARSGLRVLDDARDEPLPLARGVVVVLGFFGQRDRRRDAAEALRDDAERGGEDCRIADVLVPGLDAREVDVLEGPVGVAEAAQLARVVVRAGDGEHVADLREAERPERVRRVVRADFVRRGADEHRPAERVEAEVAVAELEDVARVVAGDEGHQPDRPVGLDAVEVVGDALHLVHVRRAGARGCSALLSHEEVLERARAAAEERQVAAAPEEAGELTTEKAGLTSGRHS